MTSPTTRSSSTSPPDDGTQHHPSSSSTMDQHLDSILELLAQPNPRLVDILECMEQHLNQRFANTE